ncbi:MAG: tetratricopeptide repeat protein, partial [Planctomycetaceae bacterium]
MPTRPQPARQSLAVAVLVAAACVAARPAAADDPPSNPAAQAAFASAAALQTREAWDLAEEEWRALLAAHPKDPLAPKARYNLAVCLSQTGRWPEARKSLEAVIAGGGDAETLAMARWELARGGFTAAQSKPSPQAFAAAAADLEAYLAGAGDRPQAAEALHYLGESLWQAGKRDDAIAAWQRFVKQHPQSPRFPEVLYALGVGQAEAGRRDDATATLDRLAREFPQHALATDAALWRANLAAAAGKPDDVERILAPLAAGKGPKAAEALDRLAQSRWDRKDWLRAAEAYARLAKEHPDSPLAAAARVSAGRALAEAGRTKEARELLEQSAAGKGPEALDAAHRLAVLEIDAGNRGRAAEVAERALAAAAARKDADPAAVSRLELDRVEALWDVPGRRAEAGAAAAALVERHPRSRSAARALDYAALALLESDKPADAVARIDAFLAAPAPDAPADAMLGLRGTRAEALLAQGRAADAAAAFRALADADAKSPRRAGWLLREGAALAAAKDWRRTHDAMARAAAELRGDDRAAAALLDATALVELGEPADAAALLAGLEQDAPKWPRRAEALLLRVRALREAGDAPAARATAERLVKEFPDGPGADVAWFRLGQIRQESGEFDAAIEAFAKSVAVRPTGPRAPWALLASGWCHDARGRAAEAVAAWTRVVDEHAGSAALAAALLARGDARRRQRDFAGGLADARRLLEAARDKAAKVEASSAGEARFLEGLCLVGQKSYGQAAASFRRLLDEQPGFAMADQVMLELGLAQSLDGKPADAAATFAALVKKFPTSGSAAEAWTEIGEARWAAGDWAAAGDAYGKAIGAAGAAGAPPGPAAEQARHKLAWTFLRRGDHAAAAREF